MKKIIALILAAAMLLSMSVCLISCDGGDNGNGNQNDNGNTGGGSTDEKVTYTVIAVDEDGNPVKDVEITFSPKGGIPIPYKTDAEGKRTYNTAKELSIIVTDLPEGYDYDKLGSAQSFGEDNTITIVLTKVEQGDPFIIKVVDQNGNPVEGVWVQMCAEICKLPVQTGADGCASYPYEEGEFRAQLNDLPDGYTVDDIKAYHDFVDGVATITITKIAD